MGNKLPPLNVYPVYHKSIDRKRGNEMMFSKLTDIVSREALTEIVETNDVRAIRVLIDYLMLKLDYASNFHERSNILETVTNLLEVKQCMTADISK